jgi:hypothetical protein
MKSGEITSQGWGNRVAHRLQRFPLTMRPSSRLFHVADPAKDAPVEPPSVRSRLPSLHGEGTAEQVSAAPGVSGEAWHKARGWASED